MEFEGNSLKESKSQGTQELNEEELKLREAKNERLKMEQAASTLENRVLYLEKINAKMNKKIESAKNRAVEIMKIKKQTIEDVESKKTHQEIKEITLKEKQQKIQEIKTIQEDKLNKSKIEHLSNSVTIAKNTKESLQVD